LAASLLPPGDIDLPQPIGRVPGDYIAKRIAAFQIDRAQRWLDVRSPQTHARLRTALAAALVSAGYSGQFNFGEIIGSDYRITQVIARWAYNTGYGASAYPSAHDDSLTCWAVFDSAEVKGVGAPEPIRRDDPDLIAAVRLFALALPD
jgi:hypothetical protein